MKTVVVWNFPAEKLPEELRGDIDPKAKVHVTVRADEELPAESAMPSLVSLIGSARGVYASPDEALDYVRRLRDEWE